jgi:hypothetical protein
LVVNLKTAKAFDLDVPLSVQQRSDEIIELALLLMARTDIPRVSGMSGVEGQADMPGRPGTSRF